MTSNPHGFGAVLRRPQEPETGMRVAYAYVTALLATLLAVPPMVWLGSSLYESGRVCAADDSLGCPILTTGALVAGTFVVLLGLGGWFLRLGWRWVVATLALVLLLVEVVVDPFSPVFLLAMLAPGIAVLLSDPTLPGRWARTALVLVMAAVSVGWWGVALASGLG